MGAPDERSAAEADARRFAAYFRVRHYEADALGHVNNAAYLHYLEQAAIEHSAAVGYPLRRYQEMGTLFIVRRTRSTTFAPPRPATCSRSSRGLRRYEARGRCATLRCTVTPRLRPTLAPSRCQPTVCSRQPTFLPASCWCEPGPSGCTSSWRVGDRCACQPNLSERSWGQGLQARRAELGRRCARAWSDDLLLALEEALAYALPRIRFAQSPVRGRERVTARPAPTPPRTLLRSAGRGTLEQTVCSFGTLMDDQHASPTRCTEAFLEARQRIESLHSTLRFRVLLGEREIELEVLR